MTSTITTFSPESRATARIIRGIIEATLNGEEIDAATARLIANCLHPGDTSYLARFAATGKLSPVNVLTELNAISLVCDEHASWVERLRDFLESIDNSEPETATDAAHPEPAPLVFIQPHTPDGLTTGGGKWVPADTTTEALEDEFFAIAGAARFGGNHAFVTASVGFYDLDISSRTTAAVITGYANGIRRHGEPFATYCTHLGHPVTTDAFTRAYRGSYDTRTEFHNAHPDSGADWLFLHGRTGLHVFTRHYDQTTSDEDAS